MNLNPKKDNTWPSEKKALIANQNLEFLGAEAQQFCLRPLLVKDIRAITRSLSQNPNERQILTEEYRLAVSDKYKENIQLRKERCFVLTHDSIYQGHLIIKNIEKRKTAEILFYHAKISEQSSLKKIKAIGHLNMNFFKELFKDFNLRFLILKVIYSPARSSKEHSFINPFQGLGPIYQNDHPFSDPLFRVSEIDFKCLTYHVPAEIFIETLVPLSSF